MRIVIAGASPLGRAALSAMIGAGHDVVLIDRDRDKLDRLSDTFDCGLIEGDCTIPSILREAGGEEPDALLALTNSDEDNILCAVVGRSVGYARVIPQIIKAELCAICDELELTDMITPHETVAAGLLDVLEDRKAPDPSAYLSDALRLAEFSVSGKFAGQEVGEIDCGQGACIIAVKRGDDEMLAADAGALKEGDVLVLVAERDRIDGLSDHLKSEDDS